jgi:hypothetical protein
MNKYVYIYVYNIYVYIYMYIYTYIYIYILNIYIYIYIYIYMYIYRLVMMSATMQEGLFSDYFSCPIIYVEGRCFNVEQHYLTDINKLVAAGQREVAAERGKKGDFEDRGGRGRGDIYRVYEYVYKYIYIYICICMHIYIYSYINIY